ncbi:unnamed protein product [Closterium sp. NIES-53]
MLSVSASAECHHLLPGLPDDLALDCLSRLTLWDLPAARCVSRAWAAAIRRRSFGRLRRIQAEERGWEGAGQGERQRNRWGGENEKGKFRGSGAVLVACVGGSAGSDSAGTHRLQWFAGCMCETCCPCGTWDLCNANAFPSRWRRLPPLPPTNPHSDPACYGAVTTVIIGTGFAIVGGAVPSQSGRPQHVRHVSVFDWHMGTWFAVQQPCMLPRLDHVVAAMGGVRWNGGHRDCLVVVGGCVIPSFPRAGASGAGSCGRVAVCASEIGGFNHHTHRGSMLSEAGVLEADWESAEKWRVVEESDAIHAIWTRTHVAQVIVADVTGTGAVTVAGVPVSDVTAKPAAEEDSTKACSSTACQASWLEMLPPPPGAHNSTAAVHATYATHATHAAPATYSVLCSLDPSLYLLVFNHLQRKWVPAGPRLSSPSPPCPPLPRPSPHVLYPRGRGSHGGYCSTPPCPSMPPYPLVPPCSPVPPCAPTEPFNRALNARLPSYATIGAASSLAVRPNAAAAGSASAAAAAAAAATNSGNQNRVRVHLQSPAHTR